MPTKEDISNAIKSALISRASIAAALYEPLKNSRSYNCEVDGCERLAYAKNMCNAHYMRSRLGRDLYKPIRATKRDLFCSKCGDECGEKGGWGFCKKHYKNERVSAIKDACISVFGGKCSKCEGKYHRSVFDFHHLKEKDHSIADLISNKSPDKIANELEKCILLCANCHRLEHFDNEF